MRSNELWDSVGVRSTVNAVFFSAGENGQAFPEKSQLSLYHLCLFKWLSVIFNPSSNQQEWVTVELGKFHPAEMLEGTKESWRCLKTGKICLLTFIAAAPGVGQGNRQSGGLAHYFLSTPVVQEVVVTKNSFLDGVTDTSVKWWGEEVGVIMWVTDLDLEWSYAWLTMPLVSESKSDWSALGSQLAGNPHPGKISGSLWLTILSQFWFLKQQPTEPVLWNVYWLSEMETGICRWGFCHVIQFKFNVQYLIKQASGSSPLRVWLELWIPSKPGEHIFGYLFIQATNLQQLHNFSIVRTAHAHMDWID